MKKVFLYLYSDTKMFLFYNDKLYEETLLY